MVAVCLYITFISFLLIFFSPNILDIIVPLNETRQPIWRLTSIMNAFIDTQRQIRTELLTWYFFLTIFIGMNTLIATETLFLMNVQHACAMFQITSYRIERTVNNNQMKSLTSLEKFSIDKNIVEAIDSHRRATKFIDSLKSTFSIVHLFAIPIVVGSLSINLYRLCDSITNKDVNGTIVLSLLVACHFAFMFLINYIGQIVIDHSEDTFKKICNTRWYATPLNMQKCLVMIMHRSMKTSTLMFCLGLFLPSLQGFAKLISKSLSYFMVIYSMHR
ncbi:uncharacterized protein LOC120359121 [Solenopsis invicta]|uniref:uncharacterized protein LOC120359121 n=1 Tax=Solenopsis invicta TaxID=13686 RepID=UPI00193CAB08|nr:uncharacterized protein LOC120359121 [Solenopsis invicta]